VTHNRLGFGEVWKAKYKGDFLAVKKVPAHCLNDQAIASLKLEAEFMKKLSHPRIVSCFGIVESEGNYCMVMELCINGSLSDFMAANPSATVDWEKRNDFAIDIAAGMNYLHRLGIIHRDLKLGNVVLDKHDRAKITDFGLSVVKSSTQTSMKMTESGTPQYMAPESFGLVPIFSTKTDVYAFSIVLWELR
jgi:serine/threonine protein kinase